MPTGVSHETIRDPDHRVTDRRGVSLCRWLVIESYYRSISLVDFRGPQLLAGLAKRLRLDDVESLV
jgi:hypothetical protein